MLFNVPQFFNIELNGHQPFLLHKSFSDLFKLFKPFRKLNFIADHLKSSLEDSLLKKN